MGKDGGRAESAATGVWNCETVAAYDPKAQSCTHRLGSRVGISSLGQGEMLAGGAGTARAVTKKHRRKNPQKAGLEIRNQHCQLIQTLSGCPRGCAAKSFGVSAALSVPSLLVLLGMSGRMR